jgi:hypothetical protein
MLKISNVIILRFLFAHNSRVTNTLTCPQGWVPQVFKLGIEIHELIGDGKEGYALPGRVGMPFIDRDEGFCLGTKRQILSATPRGKAESCDAW